MIENNRQSNTTDSNLQVFELNSLSQGGKAILIL